jgi:dynamin 1-like protein
MCACVCVYVRFYQVPKAIMCVIVNHLKEHLQTELITALYEDASIVDIMSEPAEISTRRIELQHKIIALRKADALLSDIPSFMRSTTRDANAYHPASISSTFPRSRVLSPQRNNQGLSDNIDKKRSSSATVTFEKEKENNVHNPARIGSAL